MTNIANKKSGKKTKVTLYIIIIVTIGILLICLLFHTLSYNTIHKNSENFFSKGEIVVDTISNSLIHYNHAISRYNLIYDNISKSLLQDYREHFESLGGEPELVDLERLKEEFVQKYNHNMNLYIIDANNTIIKSTEPGAAGYDFAYIPEFRSRLTNIRLQNNSEVDVISNSQSSNISMKLGYISAADHKYLLETGLMVNNAFLEYENLFKTDNTDIGADEPVKSVFFFERNAIIKNDPRAGIIDYGTYGDELSDLPDRMLYLNRAFNDKENFYIELPDKNKRIYYVYVESAVADTPSGQYLDKVVEVTYDTTPLNSIQTSTFTFFLSLTILCSLFILCFAFFIKKFVINPVSQMIDDIEIIADGDFSHKIRVTHGIEFKRLETSIEKMLVSLNIEIEQNQKKTDLLAHELKERSFIEKALTTTTAKLKLLSGITRDEILNQLSIIMRSLEKIKDNLGADHCEINSLNRAEKAAKNIKNQILFTRLYEKMGISEPIWQNLSTIVTKGEHDLNYQEGIISYSPGDSLHILADQMFDRVIYNLLDNAAKYATGMTVLVIRFEPLPTGEGVLYISDNGPGIPPDKKEKIFERGFGHNTGFGLFLTREILFITNIAITEVGIFGEGTTFKLVIPKKYWKL